MTDKRVYKISFSEFSSFLECPHKWYLVYILRFPTDVNEELVFGGAVHKVIEEIINKPMLRRKSFLPGVVKSVFKSELAEVKDVNFLTRFTNSHLPYTLVKQCQELVDKLDFFERFKEYEIIEVEHKLDGFPIVEFPDLIFAFKGYIDLILRHKTTGRYLFIDWKTSRKPWDIKVKLRDNPDFFTQLGLYKYFYSKKMDIPFNLIDVKFFNLPREVPGEQMPYDGILNETYMEFLFNKLQDVCKTIYHSTYLELDKAKITTKKNFCHRCNHNNEATCNDYDEFQVVI